MARAPQQQWQPARGWADAEASVLGGVLLRNETLHEVNGLGLRPHHFYDPRHREVFAAMVELGGAARPIDPVTLEDELGRAGKLTAAGGLAFLSGLLSTVPTADNIAHYAAIVQQASVRFRAWRSLGEAYEHAAQAGAEPADIVPRVRSLLGELEAPALGSTPPAPTAGSILRSSAFSRPQRLCSTGFEGLDHLIGGWRARCLHVVAAPTGAGKTGLLLTWARALEMPLLYVTAELDEPEVAARAAAPLIGCRPADILELKVSPEHAAAALEELPLHILDLDGIVGDAAITKIREAAESVRREEGAAPAILVDYLQLLAEENGQGPRMGITRVTLELRRLAKALDVPILAVSSVSRAYYGTRRAELDAEEDPRAWLAAGKDDGNIEYTTAVFSYLDTSTQMDADGWSSARLIVAKARAGKPGFVGLRFHGPSGAFVAAPAATAAFGPGRRQLELEAKIIGALAGLSHAPTKKDLAKLVVGFRGTDKGDAIDRLIAAGRLVVVDEIKMDAAGRRAHRAVLALPTGDQHVRSESPQP